MFVIIRRQWGYCYSMEVGRNVFCTQVIDEKSFGMPCPVFIVNGQGCCQRLWWISVALGELIHSGQAKSQKTKLRPKGQL